MKMYLSKSGQSGFRIDEMVNVIEMDIFVHFLCIILLFITFETLYVFPWEIIKDLLTALKRLDEKLHFHQESDCIFPHCLFSPFPQFHQLNLSLLSFEDMLKS